MQTLRTRRRDVGREEAADLVRRIGRELRIARVSAGLSQAQVGRLAGLSQPAVSLIERGLQPAHLAVLARLARAAGHRLSVRLLPTGTIRLRDSGQLELAEAIIGLAGSAWRPALEVPVAPPPDLRAADLVLVSPAEVLHVEIERNLADLQAQLRAGLLKREALAARHPLPVRFILALPDTRRLRAVTALHAAALEAALPMRTARVLAALRGGDPLGADGLLWLRLRRWRRSEGPHSPDR